MGKLSSPYYNKNTYLCQISFDDHTHMNLVATVLCSKLKYKAVTTDPHIYKI